MNSLFNISHDFAELFGRYEEICESNDMDAIQAWWDTMEGMDCEFRDRAVEIMLYVKQLNAEAAALKAEMDELAARRKAKETRAENLTRYVMDSMTAMGIEKIDEARAKLTIRQNPESVQLADKDDFIRWAQLCGRRDLLKYAEPTASLSAIKTALKSGDEIPGAAIVRTKRLEVK